MTDTRKKGFIGRLFSRRQEDEPFAESGEEAAAGDELPVEPETAGGSASATVESPVVEEETAVADGGGGDVPQPQQESEAGATGLFSRLKNGLQKTRKRFVGTLDTLFYGKKEIDEEFLEQLEEILLTSDLGVQTSYRLFAEVEEQVSHQLLEDPVQLRRFLQQEIGRILQTAEQPWEITAKPYVIMAVGVNGVGKTTTIGKLAAIFASQGKKVMLGAADTFRAAAIEQLEVWSERAGVPLIRQKMGADPAAVSFDTVTSAMTKEVDVVIIDTAGRLHTKVNLMDELKKMKRVVGKALPGAPHEILLVLDANTGQNAINQARMFHEALGITGLVMTKLDGTAKGGVIVGVCDELKLPVRYIGIGEQLDDLRPFKADDFVNALFERVL
ncbi:MAG: signal recognition particle-docking protein FtsY [Deltaproteobacteria bacterium]|nr:signal recognition particle-docking protein FtsY [Candidatus Anaeroferrophillus wilburensis]MBN2890016.1 signal recognition particle-docking protein FtsY [Deltaproteobacteria bacterium]